ncbi:hypothetical protein [Hydrogenimonas thermophila]|uniref:Phage integrase family protein n=1 Tax=Hydrogenimonas thermophila TaxID=223786 RepID=A0A1I5USR6_9BACT|nr:hypothetical protein [Hydrogenimonas thermophila]SFP98301.1 hypothetical protein SAMN05216234_1706 [Hydrogenimonas thermophila]
MRGSVYYQTSLLVKAIFKSGAKKKERINPNHPNYKKVASYKTMESYRNIWNNLLNYLKEHWNLKDAEKIEPVHIAAYIDYKIEYYPSRLYLNKIVSAIGKLETALEYYTQNNGNPKEYDFNIRNELKQKAVDLELVAYNYHNRAYDEPEKIIETLTDPLHQFAATIQYEGGARLEGVSLIKLEQLKGTKFDKITGKEKGVIWTKEKGGKEGEVLVSIETYKNLKNHIEKYGKFKLNKQKYADDIRNSCKKLGIHVDGTHGFRWNFAQRRLLEYGKAGYTYELALLKVSKEMKHNRASITTHYIG